jgi:hypothetical protein
VGGYAYLEVPFGLLCSFVFSEKQEIRLSAKNDFGRKRREYRDNEAGR